MERLQEQKELVPVEWLLRVLGEPEVLLLEVEVEDRQEKRAEQTVVRAGSQEIL